MVLEVDGSLKGVRGPCPGCGKEISAPMITQPQSIEVKPRPPKARLQDEHPPAASSTSAPDPRFGGIPAMGYPPPKEPQLRANPPIPKQPPIPAQGASGAGEAPAAMALRREARRRPGRSVNPIKALCEKYQIRRETFVIVKIVLAVAITIAIALGIVSITKRGVLRRSSESSEQPPKSP